MSDPQPACLYCGVESSKAPLIALIYQDKPYWICSRHLPILIHKPQELAKKLPGAEWLVGVDESAEHAD